MKTTKTTFSAPPEVGSRVRALAKHRKTTVAATLAAIVNDAYAAAGLGATDAINIINCYDPEGEYFEADLLGRYRVKLSPSDASALSATLAYVLENGGKKSVGAPAPEVGMLNIDMHQPMYVARRGAGMVIEGEGRDLSSDDRSPKRFSLTMSIATAVEIRRELNAAIRPH